MKDNGHSNGGHLDIRDVYRMLRDGGGKVVDVRTTTEFGKGHIEGSRNIPMSHLKHHTPEVIRNLDEPVVLVSSSGKRAQKAQALLEEAGMSNIRILENGLEGWKKAEMPFPASANPAHEERMERLARTIRLASGALSLAGAVAGIVRRKNLGLLAGLAIGGLLVSGFSKRSVVHKVMSSVPRNSRHYDLHQALGLISPGQVSRYRS